MHYKQRPLTSSVKAILSLSFVFIILSCSTLSAQSREEKKLHVKAVNALNAGKFSKAVSIYEDLIKLDPKNPDYNYELGLAIIEEGIHKGDAARYLDVAIAQTTEDTLPDLFLYAGLAHQFLGEYNVAIEFFETYKRLAEKNGIDLSEAKYNVDRLITMSESAKLQFENNMRYLKIENLGPSINSEYPDYAPVVKKDQSMILFTSRRPNTTGGEIASDDKYYEDVYFSLNNNGEWIPASNYDSSNVYMNEQINTPLHDATITFANNENVLLIYRESDVWQSKLENSQWTIPVRMKSASTDEGFEPSVFLTDDGKTMFVVSDISSGFGGTDVYISTKDANGNWAPLENLGDQVNTKFDEDAPFLTRDGNTLYFSSKGHNSIGRYDIFKSIKDEYGVWQAPENLGVPINTPGDDIFFITTDEGALGYYASDRPEGYGDMDIYRIVLDCKEVSATIIRGKLFSEDRQAPVSGSISIYDPQSGKLINKYLSDPLTGKYQMRLNTAKEYAFEINAEGYQKHNGTFTVPKQCEYYSLYQEVKIDNIEDDNGRVIAQRAYVNNAFFDIHNKIEEDFQIEDAKDLDDVVIDSLSSELAAKYNPTELDNYIQLIEVRDIKGNLLGSESLGERSVVQVESSEEIVRKYVARIEKADAHFNDEEYPESRADYSIASAIKPDEEYPIQQMEKIDKILINQSEAQLAATNPEPEMEIFNTAEALSASGQNNSAYNDLIARADEALIGSNYQDAKKSYLEAQAMNSAATYPTEQIALIDKISAVGSESYSGLVARGDALFNAEEWNPAEDAYRSALDLRLDEYPVGKITELEQKRQAEAKAVAAESGTPISNEILEYLDFITEADVNLNLKNYNQAKEQYNQALSIDGSQQYPKNQLELANRLESADAAQMASKAVTSGNSYADLITRGDQLFMEKKWEEAERMYRKALDLKLDDYPIRKITEAQENNVGNQIATSSSMNGLDESTMKTYLSMISEADAALNLKDYAKARSSYQQAQEINQSASYPADQLALINRLDAGSVGSSYADLIARADKAYNNGQYDNAESLYRQALNIKIDDYPIERITQSEEKSVEGQIETGNIRSNVSKAKMKDYLEVITEADRALVNKNYELATQKYQQAQSVNVSESYPREQIALINKLQMGGTGSSYADLIAKGDASYANGQFDQAEKMYRKALDLKIDPYPIRMITRAEETAVSNQLLAGKSENGMDQAGLNAYLTMISEADAALNIQDYELAKSSYQKAQTLNKTKAYPREQIALIERLEANLGGSPYAKLIADADRAYANENYEAAEKMYRKALNIKLDDYAVRMVTLAEEKALENNISAGITSGNMSATQMKTYLSLISEADVALNLKDFELARTKYNEAQSLNPTDSYTRDQMNLINRLEADLDDASYAQLIARGDRAYTKNDFETAQKMYRRALELKIDDYPIRMITRAEESDVSTQLNGGNADLNVKKMESYLELISEADVALNTGNYEAARSGYEKAQKENKDNSYTAEQIELIDRLENQLAQSPYAQLIAKADKAYDDKEFAKAEMLYRQALDLKVDNYPIKRITESEENDVEVAIDNGGKEAAVDKKTLESYLAKIEEANAALIETDFSRALKAYQEAGRINSKDMYPADQIALIHRLNAEGFDSPYEQLLADADLAFANGDFERSEMLYREALDLKINDYPVRMITESEESRVNESITTSSGSNPSSLARLNTYLSLIEEADVALNLKDYDLARAKYAEAQSIKSSEDYPSDQLMLIDRLEANIGETPFAQLIARADQAYRMENFIKSEELYREALTYKMDDYAIRMITQSEENDVEGILANGTNGNKLNPADQGKMNVYLTTIKEADLALNQKKYSEALASYQKAKKLDPEVSYPQDQIDLINSLGAGSEGGEFAGLIARGDAAFNNKQWDNAEEAYRAALDIKSDDYAMKQIMEIERMRQLASSEATPQSNEYQNLIAAGDAALASEQYPSAKENYDKALNLDESQTYPREQIARIEKLMAQQEDQRFNELIAKGDGAFDAKNWDGAEKAYTDALLIKQSQYAKDQIAAIADLKSGASGATAMPLTGETKQAYDAAIAEGDAAMETKSYDDAKAAYEKATLISQNESYPRTQLAKIDQLQAQNIEQRYNTMIADADKAYFRSDFATAEKLYKEALELKEDTYPKGQLALIQTKRNEMQSQITENDNYKELIAQGDQAMNRKDYETARMAYEKASGIKEKESYPKSQLKLIAMKEDQLAQQEKFARLVAAGDDAMKANELTKAEESYKSALVINQSPEVEEKLALVSMKREQNLQDFQYNSSVEAGNRAYDAGNLDMAVAHYKKALSLKDESFPADQIAKIEAQRSIASAETPKPKTTSASTPSSSKAEPKAESKMTVNNTPQKAAPQKSTAEATDLNSSKSTIDGETIVFRNILFDFDKFDLRKASIEELNKIYAYLENKGEVSIQIDGHADWIGTVEYNLSLSEKRALAAYNYLAEKGISEDRMLVQFFGEAVPIAPNANADGSDNPEGRQLNRRCEFKLDKTGTAENITLKF